MTDLRWLDMAECRGSSLATFYDDPWPGGKLDEDAVEISRKVCHDCPVRRACFADKMEYERGKEQVDRYGVQAYLSPGQRESIEKRGIGQCHGCGAWRDPVYLAKGILRCPRQCGVPERTIIPPPHQGDQWTKRHTTLSKRIVGWLIDSVDPGDDVPTPRRMSEMMGGVRYSDVLRVYRELVTDGTLLQSGQDYSRGAKVASHNWKPNWYDSMPKEA